MKKFEPALVLMVVIPFGVIAVLSILAALLRDPPPSVVEDAQLDVVYALEVWCGESPVRMVGDAERVAAWARANHVECPE